MIKRLRALNSLPVYNITDSNKFKTYGRLINGYNFSSLISYMHNKTTIPEEGNIYLASVNEMESLSIKEEISQGLYGSMPIQIGYCNGKNSTYNGFEYHKGSEVNIAVTSFVMALGHRWDIVDNSYHVDQAELFFVEQGSAIELYQTTLHLAPLRVDSSGFKNIVVLPQKTNSPLAHRKEPRGEEDDLLLQTNKWVIAHPLREALIKQGAFAGLLGENREFYYQ